MGFNLAAIRHKSLATRHDSKKNIQSRKNLAPSRQRYFAQDERTQERQKYVEDRSRERFHKLRGYGKHKPRRRKRKH
ncbi:hypothetical protein KA107_03070 [Candidatus Pacearchaeota archaeon]|nr:hypothetical protein [Candidatus Pacearchaeota archaeon]